MATAKAAAVACVLLQTLAPGALAGAPAATGDLPRLPHVSDPRSEPGLGQEFHRHLMSFDVTAGVRGTGCGGNFQRCCEEDTCGDSSLTCVQSTSCVKCGTSGRPVCTAEGTEPCGAGLVVRQGICFTDFGVSFGGRSGAPPGSYGGPTPAPEPTPEPPTPEPTPEPTPDPGEDGIGGEECGVAFGSCCDSEEPCGDGLACRFGQTCVPCGAFGQPTCDSDPPCDPGYKALDSICVADPDDTRPPAPKSPRTGIPGGKFSFKETVTIPAGSKKTNKLNPEFKLRGWS